MTSEFHPSIPVDTGIDHIPAGRFEEAVAFIVETPWPQRPAPLLPFIRKTFDLDVATAIAAIKESNRIRCSGSADASGS